MHLCDNALRAKQAWEDKIAKEEQRKKRRRDMVLHAVNGIQEFPNTDFGGTFDNA